MSLADELLADLDSFEEEAQGAEGYDEGYDHMESEQIAANGDRMDEDQPEADVNMEHSSHEEIEQMMLAKVNDVKSVAKLLGSKSFKEVLKKIEHYKAEQRNVTHISGPVEEDPEYKLIVQANELTVNIDHEIALVHKFIRDHYASKFPELEGLVTNPIEYARTVRAIKNESDLASIDLHSILPPSTVMIVSVTATTTNGIPLSEEQLKIVIEACDMLLALDAAKQMIMEYVASRMSLIAPNLTAVVGSTTAARLLGAAGGLTALTKMPACNVQVLGAQKKVSTGFSSVTMKQHAGFIYYSEICMQAPPDLRMKMQKMLAAKCVLAARIDRVHESKNGAQGRKMREDIEQKLEKLTEPPPKKDVKALPVPDEGPRKRRGGRRVRKQKEAYAMTDLRRAQNRMAFGVAEDEASAFEDSKGLGLIGNQVGKIRGSGIDLRTKAKVPKKKQWTSSSNVSGLSTSITFTPVQGMEFVDPTAAAEKIKKANDRYFSGGSYLKVGKKPE
ncbi:uncharacterized protein VTP21DRAFT_845 [Calcarisporiella thermophila]|uniref:uncharacterized protein n=1 Tax=Calcarisporiella thermophila TaxID=911321 RepID=UPI003741EF02